MVERSIVLLGLERDCPRRLDMGSLTEDEVVLTLVTETERPS